MAARESALKAWGSNRPLRDCVYGPFSVTQDEANDMERSGSSNTRFEGNQAKLPLHPTICTLAKIEAH